MVPLLLRLSFLVLATSLLAYKFNTIVPEPYLDEVFHIPQSQRYCEGRWTEWDDKITTPFGLYVLSYIYSRVLLPIFPYFGQDYICSTPILRSFNTLGITIVLPLLSYRVSRRHQRNKFDAANDAISIGFFPLLFFFGGLFYTDIWSTVFLLAAYERVLAGNAWASAVLSAISLLFRQTNVLWTAFFCVFNVLSRLEREAIALKKKDKGGSPPKFIISSYQQILENAWQTGDVYNPLLAEADIPGGWCLSGIVVSITSLLFSVLRFPLQAFLAIIPFMTVITGFVAFVTWNGGIVLGDKTAHVATFHAPQLFYFSLFTMFTSWPLVITPRLPLHFLYENFPIIFPAPRGSIQQVPIRTSTVQKVARTFLTLAILTGMGLVVHYNTYLHPYLLADNRHYPFYLFRRTIMVHPAVKYLAVPVYYACGWCVLHALQQPTLQSRLTRNNGDVTTIWALAYFAAFFGSVIGAGLVEFRYFVPAWVLWRLAVGSKGVDQDQGGSWRWWLEMSWFAGINTATAWLFLYRGFSWENEPGKVQRFMW
ncbi:alpha-1,2 glucosyltransferas-like protein alg10 [Tirmania nivea]|nr:alpha-1,2 glucosyltransferas-like protein alg10 [Tirmania nivea]